MAQPGANFHFIPQIYPADGPVTALPELRFRFIRADIPQLPQKPIAKCELTRAGMNLLFRICGIRGFCVRSTLR
jgi:hypothetical protein